MRRALRRAARLAQVLVKNAGSATYKPRCMFKCYRQSARFFPALRVAECAMTRWAIAAHKAAYTNEFNLEIVRRSDQPIMDVQWDFIVIVSNRRV